MSSEIRLIHTVEVQNELGEGIIWDAQRQCLWWTDIQQCRLYQYFINEDRLIETTTPERLCCLSPIANSERLVCAFESGFAFFDPVSSKIEWIEKLEADNPGTRFNDGKTDRQGRFWVGTMMEDEDRATSGGSLYCLDHDLSVSRHLGDLHITNSLCWSPDGALAYHTDTPSREIMVYQSATQPPGLTQPKSSVITNDGCAPAACKRTRAQGCRSACPTLW
ncbi:MAG: SMP-30/gluconolactonase/LRE family protein, partial [Pseudomonadota bacterium]